MNIGLFTVERERLSRSDVSTRSRAPNTARLCKYKQISNKTTSLAVGPLVRLSVGRYLPSVGDSRSIALSINRSVDRCRSNQHVVVCRVRDTTQSPYARPHVHPRTHTHTRTHAHAHTPNHTFLINFFFNASLAECSHIYNVVQKARRLPRTKKA